MKFTKAKKPRRFIQLLKSIAPFLVGLIIGLIWNSNSQLYSRIANNSFESEISSLIRSSNNELSSFTDHQLIDGWKPVYVYYGKPEGLKSSRPPMFQQQNSNEGSQVRQDEIIDALMTSYQSQLSSVSSTSEDKTNFYFIDLAANDATALSNTYRLEQKGWNGLCVEPNPVYWFRLAHRKCMIAGAFVGGDDLMQVEVSLKTNEFGGIVGEKFDNSEEQLGKLNRSFAEKENRYTISISTMFRQFNVPTTIDYLSLDVEGAEELIMNEFPFSKYTIRFLTIERPKVGLSALLTKKKYHFVMMLVHWGETLWVHESVLERLDMSEIKTIVTKNMVPARRIKKGQQYFDINSGEYAIKN